MTLSRNSRATISVGNRQDDVIITSTVAEGNVRSQKSLITDSTSTIGESNGTIVLLTPSIGKRSDSTNILVEIDVSRSESNSTALTITERNRSNLILHNVESIRTIEEEDDGGISPVTAEVSGDSRNGQVVFNLENVLSISRIDGGVLPEELEGIHQVSMIGSAIINHERINHSLHRSEARSVVLTICARRNRDETHRTIDSKIRSILIVTNESMRECRNVVTRIHQGVGTNDRNLAAFASGNKRILEGDSNKTAVIVSTESRISLFHILKIVIQSIDRSKLKFFSKFSKNGRIASIENFRVRSRNHNRSDGVASLIVEGHHIGFTTIVVNHENGGLVCLMARSSEFFVTIAMSNVNCRSIRNLHGESHIATEIKQICITIITQFSNITIDITVPRNSSILRIFRESTEFIIRTIIRTRMIINNEHQIRNTVILIRSSQLKTVPTLSTVQCTNIDRFQTSNTDSIICVFERFLISSGQINLNIILHSRRGTIGIVKSEG